MLQHQDGSCAQWKPGCHLALMGAAPDTGNLGVNALFRSVMHGLSQRLHEPQITVFDNGVGLRQFRSGRYLPSYQRCGMINSRRLYRPESLLNMRASALFGGLFNPGVKILKQARAVLDISGGDSFTDLYGPHRFELITRPKLLALKCRRPLFLLPQTYGPFNNARERQIAQQILRDVHTAWARDIYSFQAMRQLLGIDFDRDRHLCGVDVAFSLPKAPPSVPLSRRVVHWLRDKDHELVGINPSGLILNDPDSSRERYGFRADYTQAVLKIVQNILRDSSAHILLIPHVHAPTGHPESDLDACERIYQMLSAQQRCRTAIIRERLDELETKWLISQLNWFCGTRMHSTIAALSSGIATASIAYSDKTLGVFHSCGQEKEVFDPRRLSTADLIDAVGDAFLRRKNVSESLQVNLPKTLATAKRQMDRIVHDCLLTSSRSERELA